MIENLLISLQFPGGLWAGLIIIMLVSAIALIFAVKQAKQGFEDESGFYYDSKIRSISNGSRPARPSSSSASPFSCQHSRAQSRKSKKRMNARSQKIHPQIY